MLQSHYQYKMERPLQSNAVNSRVEPTEPPIAVSCFSKRYTNSIPATDNGSHAADSDSEDGSTSNSSTVSSVCSAKTSYFRKYSLDEKEG